jgi:cytochrome c
MGGKFAVVTVLSLSLLGAALAGCDGDKAAASDNVNGDPKRGAELIQSFGCGGCHNIPGIANANGNVGPPLQRVGTRVYIAGLLRNSPDNMAFWIEDPQAVLPGNAMPRMGISKDEARDIAAFLFTLR